MSIPLFDRLNDWVGAQLAASSSAEPFAFLFLGRLLASLLPCVYPLYPITVSILRGRRSELGRYAHPLAYYFGLSGVYFSFGIVAVLTGGAFNEVLRLPVANLAIGAALFALALATVGFLHFPAISGDFQPKDQGLPGSVVMGGLAGLLSSACVGPVVVSILVGLPRTRKQSPSARRSWHRRRCLLSASASASRSCSSACWAYPCPGEDAGRWPCSGPSAH